MKRTQLFVFALLLVVAVAGAAALYYFALGPTEAATGPIEAVPLSADSPAEASQSADSGSPAAGIPGEPATASIAPTNTAVAATGDTAEQGETGGSTATSGGGVVLYQIDPAASQVSFTLDEELRGQPTTVVGTSNQVSGEIALNAAKLDATQVGVILVNARTLETDESRRNQAIRNFILQTDAYEFIVFTPTAIAGLSGATAPGALVSFEISGDLTIRELTRPVVFAVTGSLNAEGSIEGYASTVINRGDFGLTIPNVPFVANVGEEVVLEIDFVARPVAGG